MATKKDFFTVQKSHSRIKSQIVVNYFVAWAKIMLRQSCPQITYLDLFSGKGKYDDGNLSTPLLLFNAIEEEGNLRDKLRVYFYEDKPENYKALEKNIKHHPLYTKLITKPQIDTQTIDETIVSRLPRGKCTFAFIDPHGYHGVSAKLLTSIISGWGNDCIFYLSTTGIIRNLKLETEKPHMERLFSAEGFKDLKARLKALPLQKSSYLKEMEIIELLARVLSSQKQLYIRPFAMEFAGRRRRNYFLIFMSAHWLGFKIIKEVMAKYSILDDAGIPLFLYSETREQSNAQGLGISELQEKLLKRLQDDFSGKSLIVEKVFELCHQMGYPYIESNIKDAIIKLENEMLVNIDIPPEQRIRKGKMTLGKGRTVTFLD